MNGVNFEGRIGMINFLFVLTMISIISVNIILTGMRFI